MEYQGKIYGKVGKHYFPLVKTSEDIDNADKLIRELTESLSCLVFLHECEQEGLSSGQPTPEMWFEAVNKASEVLTKINQTNGKS